MSTREARGRITQQYYVSIHLLCSPYVCIVLQDIESPFHARYFGACHKHDPGAGCGIVLSGGPTVYIKCGVISDGGMRESLVRG